MTGKRLENWPICALFELGLIFGPISEMKYYLAEYIYYSVNEKLNTLPHGHHVHSYPHGVLHESQQIQQQH